MNAKIVILSAIHPQPAAGDSALTCKIVVAECLEQANVPAEEAVVAALRTLRAPVHQLPGCAHRLAGDLGDHVTVLAVPPGGRLGTPLPLHIGVLDRLTVHSGIIKELMTARTEATLQELGTLLEAAVWRPRDRGRQLRTTRRTPEPIAANVARGANDPLCPQGGIEGWLGCAARPVGLLLAERGVATLTGPRLEGIRQRALHQLARKTRRVRSGV